MLQGSLTSWRSPHSRGIVREAHFPLKHWNCSLPPYVKSPQGPRRFCSYCDRCLIFHIPMQKWLEWMAGWEKLYDLNPPSALGALALLLPVLLMHAMEAFHILPEPWWYQHSVFWLIFPQKISCENVIKVRMYC